jgi:hypothetical protein
MNDFGTVNPHRGRNSRKADSPVTSKMDRGHKTITTTRQGWLGRTNYKVTVHVLDRKTRETATAVSETPWESPRCVRLRALAKLT